MQVFLRPDDETVLSDGKKAGDTHTSEAVSLKEGWLPGVLCIQAAVEAVLELHKPITDDGNSLRNWLGMGNGKPRDYCNECEVDGYTAVPYPCPTVTAIQSALGETDANN